MLAEFTVSPPSNFFRLREDAAALNGRGGYSFLSIQSKSTSTKRAKTVSKSKAKQLLGAILAKYDVLEVELQLEM
jgi:hypothetical protein